MSEKWRKDIEGEATKDIYCFKSRVGLERIVLVDNL